MAMMSDFVSAIKQIGSERGIDSEKIFTVLEEALLRAYYKQVGIEVERVEQEDGSYEEVVKDKIGKTRVEIERDSGKFQIFVEKEVVKRVKNKKKEISLKEAQNISTDLGVGDIIEIEVPLEDFGRIAAQVAKQVVFQKIGQLEREAVLDEYRDKVGQVFNAMMQRMHGGNAVLEIGKATVYMPPEEQIGNEFYRIGQRYKVLLKSIERENNSDKLIVSRADPDFLIELFRMEVPEIDSGAVEIKACAREAGIRSKIAVESLQEGIDPIGSCVGQRGIRIANVMTELGEEKIDVIEWRESIEEFITNALSPARIESVELEDGKAIVKAAKGQLSLAIGHNGQNVRLASKLTGWPIDIYSDDEDSGKAKDDQSNDDNDNADEKGSNKNKGKNKSGKKKKSTKKEKIDKQDGKSNDGKKKKSTKKRK